MSFLFDSRRLESTAANPIVGLERSKPSGWSERFLTIDGEQRFLTGYWCDTCYFVFKRLPGGVTKSPLDIAQMLRGGIANLNEAPVEALLQSLPAGRFEALLLSTTPILVNPGGELDYFCHGLQGEWDPPYDDMTGMPAYPATDYYITESCTFLGRDDRLFEFIVPLYPTRFTRRSRVDEWRETLLRDSSTAVAVSVIDLKTPTVYTDPPKARHVCITHYLLDGHHRILAAAELQKPIQLLSFLYFDQSSLREEYIEEALAALPKMTL
jgi:hypothetical protein